MKRFLAIVILLCLGCDSLEESKIILNTSASNHPVIPRFEYGFSVDSFLILKKEIQSGESLGKILVENGVSYRQVDAIARSSRKTDFDVRYLKAGHSYALLCQQDSSGKSLAHVFIYEEDKINFVVYDFRDSLNIYRAQKEIVIKLIEVAGVIDKGSSFFLTGASLGMSDRLCEIISDEIYCWTLDFRHVQPGDKFKVIYEAKYLQGEFVGVGGVKAVYFSHFDDEFYAFPFNDSGFDDYFDKTGNNLRKFFLKTPVKNSRISSRYSRNRFHPVQKRWKSHKGTDYAAKRGTPIWSTAAGVIEAATYTKYNGNYVKVRHNATYTTQYLHMSKIAKDIRPGVKVAQGQTIGYVGSTGLATGPHVCYRFWKNGVQVDPFKSKLPPSDPISADSKEKFLLLKDSLSFLLDKIPFLEYDLDLGDTINL
ncbi:MAG: peptidase M23 [Flavobacteriales bacterium]|nr:peptidase M23 [Flavobacteriales bacterium]